MGTDHLESIDAIYFKRGATWQDRLQMWLSARVPSGGFADSHEMAVDLSVQAARSLRMIVNMGPFVLLEFMALKTYYNAYQRPTILGGKPVGQMRTRVDESVSDNPDQIHFGAVTLNGTGVRFYGEYGVVLKNADIPATTQIMDRNSWLVEFPPLKDPAAGVVQTGKVRKETAARLKGKWQDDLLPIVKLKVLPQIGHPVRLPTSGVISEAVLQDESFVEVHKGESFGPGNVHEVREAPQDASIESDAADRERRGFPLTPDEQIWLRRRRQVASALQTSGLRRRIVATSGRERG